MALIARTKSPIFPASAPCCLPGPFGFQHNQIYTLNPSYLPMFIFERFAEVDPAGPWQQIALGIPRLLERSARHGYAMDWVNYVPGDGFYPAPALSHRQRRQRCPRRQLRRHPRLSLGRHDRRHRHSRAQVLNAIPAMSDYLANHDAPPEKVSDQGIPMAQDGPVGFSAAVLPYLRAFPDASRPAPSRRCA